MNPNDPNVEVVQAVARILGDLTEQLVFVGGCATGLLITDDARPAVRATRDVDVITEVANMGAYYKLTSKLEELGFQPAGEISCRWRHGDFLVDVMPTDENILGFTNDWYKEAAKDAASFTLPDGQRIRLISAPLFVATKIEAFHGRGNGDFGMSHDIEDIVSVVDGREELVSEVMQSNDKLRSYLREEVDNLLATREFVDTLPWHLAPDPANQDRVSIVIARLRQIAGL